MSGHSETTGSNTAGIALKASFPSTIPVLAGYIFLGITYGILMVTSGFPVYYPVLTAALVYTGSMEFLLVSILSSPFNPLSCFVTALMVGARHLFYGISMLDRYKGAGWKKFYLIYTTSDETFAVNYSAKIPEGVDRYWYYFWVSLLDQLYWIAGSAIGAVCGSLLTGFNLRGLDFVMTAMFVTIFMDQWVKDSHKLAVPDRAQKDEAPAAGRSGHKSGGRQTAAGEGVNRLNLLNSHTSEFVGVIGSLVCLLIFGPDNFIVPSMIVILAALTLLRPYLTGLEIKSIPAGAEHKTDCEDVNQEQRDGVSDTAFTDQEDAQR